ncbi:MAG: sigma 54-interacting transcriptional regulator [Candidatus Binatia bacterium]|nr:sigma 54-interacting transcriptional regulator [Candidatus Binatia bacterium]MDG2010647.1 sigma 54-interacting transcriptional regulator [Candidatus Binatia bacterium]
MGRGIDRILGSSAAVVALRDAIRLYAVADGTVLIEGETGAGKELVARAVHEEGRRSAGPFSSVDCGALAESLFESELFGHERGAFTGAVGARRGLVAAASGGTLFLDEIENLPLAQQAKLLRLVQEREFRALGSERMRRADLRLVVATNENLADLVVRGLFRADLFYRLDVLRIAVPSLRDRLDDLPELLLDLLARSAGGDAPGVPPPPEQLVRLRQRSWPGNVRELANLAERVAALAPAVGWEHAWRVAIAGQRALPARPGPAGRLHKVVALQGLPQAESGNNRVSEPTSRERTDAAAMNYLEAESLRQALEQHRWRREDAARALGISRVTLWRRMRRCGLADEN